MTSSQPLKKTLEKPLVEHFFQRSVGRWRSERRYYTLPDGKIKEVVSLITIRFLEQGSTELVHLAGLHQLSDETILTCGAHVRWESSDTVSGREESTGETLFGALDDILYRDRGFATSDPVTALFSFSNPDTMQLRTEYKGSVFEEELKLIGTKYRTRQTIISRAGEQKMIGQYLEKRLD
ncbi:MAG: phycobiliprotein lyase [Gemmatimonadaceae bacterium]|nr:phycobiliprotein lyase [Gloeobacterales cyanobacterium ES-bin-141]